MAHYYISERVPLSIDGSYSIGSLVVLTGLSSIQGKLMR